VFLLDSDFRIERPRRYYRQGFDLVFPRDQPNDSISAPETQLSPPDNDTQNQSAFPRTWTSKVFHNLPQRDSEKETRPTLNPDDDMRSSPSSSTANLGAPTPLLDPSTNTNPLQDDTDIWAQEADQRVLGGLEDEKLQPAQAHEKSRIVHSRDVSKHTFYIVNSQMRLKLVAKSTVSRFRLSVGVTYCCLNRDKCSNLSQPSRKQHQRHRILEAIGLAAFHRSG
jgi:phospholipase D1/2